MLIPTPKQLRELRMRLNLTQQSCADIIHKSLSHWQKLEQGSYKSAIDFNQFKTFLNETNSQKIFEEILNNS